MTNITETLSDPKVEAIHRVYDAVARGDIAGVLAELADDIDWAAESAGTAVPWWGVRHGKDDVARFFMEIGTNIEIGEFTPLTYAYNETDVIVPVRWDYTVRATGKKAAMIMQHWWRFADGKVVYFRGAEDTAQSQAAFSA